MLFSIIALFMVQNGSDTLDAFFHHSSLYGSKWQWYLRCFFHHSSLYGSKFSIYVTAIHLLQILLNWTNQSVVAGIK
jgi:hypothetical protein